MNHKRITGRAQRHITVVPVKYEKCRRSCQ